MKSPLARLAAVALLSWSVLAGAEAAPVRLRLDPDHSFPSFEADHLGISVWRGKFNRSRGQVTLDREAGSGVVSVEIELASIDFGQEALNRWARGREFFDVAKHPRARYLGRLEGFVDGRPTRAVGELRLHGVTRPVTLTIERFKCIPHPLNQRELCGADAKGRFDRSEFGLDAGKDYGFDMKVDLRIQVEAVAEP